MKCFVLGVASDCIVIAVTVRDVGDFQQDSEGEVEHVVYRPGA